MLRSCSVVEQAGAEQLMILREVLVKEAGSEMKEHRCKRKSRYKEHVVWEVGEAGSKQALQLATPFFEMGWKHSKVGAVARQTTHSAANILITSIFVAKIRVLKNKISICLQLCITYILTLLMPTATKMNCSLRRRRSCPR